MPAKSVREMTESERRRHSIGAKAFRSTIVGSILLVLVILATGLTLYVSALVGQYTQRAFNTSSNAEAILREMVDVRPLSEEVIRIYHGMTEEERAQVGTDAYRSRFAALTEREDYTAIRKVLKDFLASSDAFAVYFVYTDGLPEATNTDYDLFGRDRAVDVLNSAPDRSPEELLRAVSTAVNEFVGEEEQFDDLTMLCIEYKGS